jgi:hypothetical protein
MRTYFDILAFAQNIEMCSFHYPGYQASCVESLYCVRNFDAFYIFTIKFSKSWPRNFQVSSQAIKIKPYKYCCLYSQYKILPCIYKVMYYISM